MGAGMFVLGARLVMAGMALVVAGDGGGASSRGHKVVAAAAERVAIVPGPESHIAR
jgi:cell division GTPase FtsZ